MNSLLDEQLALSGFLDQLDQVSLQELLTLRPVTRLNVQSTLFDIAQELLSEKSIQHALKQVSLNNAKAIVDADAEIPEQAIKLALAHPRFGYYQSVINSIQNQTNLDRLQPQNAAQMLIEDDPKALAQSADAAFSSTSSLSELLWRLNREAIPRNANGTLLMAERRRLKDAGFGDGNHYPSALLETALSAGLVQAQSHWSINAQGQKWLQQDSKQRWLLIRDTLLAQLSDEIYQHGELLEAEAWKSIHPWDSEWPTLSQKWQEQLQQWGLISANLKRNPWSNNNTSADAAEQSKSELSAHFPPEVQQVYLQQDLTVIAPGPLAAPIDYQLRLISASGSSSQASSYRITANSLAQAINKGQSPEQIRKFLSEISMHPLPQPLSFELAELEEKYLALELSSENGTSILRSAEQNLLNTIETDPQLRHLGFSRISETALQSSWDPQQLSEQLAAARIVSQKQWQAPIIETALNEDAEHPEPKLAQILGTIISNRPEPNSAKWLEQLLEPLVRYRETVHIKLLNSQQEELEFTVELRGLSPQRVRGVDHSASAERTIPLAAITQITKGEQLLFYKEHSSA